MRSTGKDIANYGLEGDIVTIFSLRDVLLKYTLTPTPTPILCKSVWSRTSFGDVEPGSGKNQGNKKVRV